jgi:hypothetical protein
MYYIVVMREDSISTIYQRTFKSYEEAKTFFDKQKEHFFFCKLCEVIED